MTVNWVRYRGRALVCCAPPYSRADSRQLIAERFHIARSYHLLDFAAEEKIQRPIQAQDEVQHCHAHRLRVTESGSIFCQRLRFTL
jgi:1,2-phenylacetyl-CoA epoxidase catalytic subunit